jgi:hypothetical protein
MPNIQNTEFNKNVSMVYIEEAGFTGYRGLSFSNLDDNGSNISSSAPSSSNGTVLNANNFRKELFIQNLNTGILYVDYGINAAPNNFNFVLAANSSLNAGDGGSISDLNYTGIVSVSGLNSLYIAWERS